ncbi:MAG: RNA-guided endonuclease InsQ/TnpB family protein [Streptosporangiales bacterium]
MSRYRLLPSPEQALILRSHCTRARFVWNLALEQQSWWRPGRPSAPGWVEQCHQLSAARAEHGWLAAGSAVVQQQALRDFSQAMANFLHGTHRKPTWRKAGRDEGFRIVALGPGQVRRLNRHRGRVFIPKAGWVQFRWSRAVPHAKSFRVKLDRAGRWHLAFAALPAPIPGPGTGEIVGVDRGIAVSAALSTGQMLTCAHLSPSRQRRLKRLQRRLARAKRGSNRRTQVKSAVARLRAREADARKDWAEKLSTDLARRFDVIRVEDLRITHMTRSGKGSLEAPGRQVRAKAGLNREILASGWGILIKRLEDKAPARVEKINPAYTSQRCSACGHVAGENRKSQAVFACTACCYRCNADVNAARNIAAGHAVTARGGPPLGRPVNREPQLALLSPQASEAGIPVLQAGEDVK